jgi:hypothetical protein
MSNNTSSKGIAGVIAASSLGTLIEWYDFYIFGRLLLLQQSFSHQETQQQPCFPRLLLLPQGL